MSSAAMAGVRHLFQKKMMDKRQREAVVESFRRADKNGDGRLSAEEIYGIFQEHRVAVTMQEVKDIVTNADVDGTGTLSVKEFVNSAKAVEAVDSAEKGEVIKHHRTSSHKPVSKGGPRMETADIAFKLFDRDQDGYITKSEFNKLSKNLTKEQIQKAFSKFDQDGDGRLDIKEFKKMMHKYEVANHNTKNT